ncbi:MAG: glycosyltransferase family 9 protein [Chitinophagales bacterium]
MSRLLHLCMVQKILVIQTAFIGDVVLATGLLEKLHSYFPKAQIDFLVRKGNESLLSNHPFLHETIVWDKRQNKTANLWKTLRQIRSRKYDMLINVQRFAATGILTAFSGAAETIGFDKNPFSFLFSKKIKHIIGEEGAGLHEIDRNQSLIAGITDPQAAKPRLYPTQADEAAVSGYKKIPYITISPASVWFTKQYPREKWCSFIKTIPKLYSIYFLGAPSDQSLCEEILRSAPDYNTLNLAGKLSFLQSAALMRDAQMNFVNDSAPLHFASAMNAPVTAVYCSTIPAFGFGPLSDRSYIVETKKALDCRPCGLHGFKACPKGHFKCAYEIEDSQLAEVLQ